MSKSFKERIIEFFKFLLYLFSRKESNQETVTSSDEANQSEDVADHTSIEDYSDQIETPDQTIPPVSSDAESMAFPSKKNDFPVISFVNSSATSQVNYSDIKSEGYTDINYKISRLETSALYYKKVLPDIVEKAKSAGLYTRAWFSGNLNNDNTRANSSKSSWDTFVDEMVVAVKGCADLGIPVHIDLDNGELSANVAKTTAFIKKLKEAIAGKVEFTTTVMPDAPYYDDSDAYGEKYSELGPLVTYLSPEIYGFSYTDDETKMTNAVKSMLKTVPNLMPTIQIISDKDVRLTKEQMQKQIQIMKQAGCKGVFAFRWFGKMEGSSTSTETTETTEVTSNDTKFQPDDDGCYNSPRYFTDSNMYQDQSTWCGLNVVQQVFKELFNVTVKESDLYAYGYTGSGGTAPTDLKKIITTHAKKLGHEVTIETHPFSSFGWDKIAQAVSDPDIGVFFHELYKDTWGHYDYCVSVCPINIYMANSLQGQVIGYPRATMQSWFSGIVSDNSIYLIKKVS